jgi:hypothetical protein
MLRRVAVVITDVSEELSAAISRVRIIGELGTTLFVTSKRLTLRRVLSITRNEKRHTLIIESRVLINISEISSTKTILIRRIAVSSSFTEGSRSEIDLNYRVMLHYSK